MGIAKSELQPPFRPQDLLPFDRFISYCGDRGVRTDSGQLEYYEKRGLLLPAVRVMPWLVEARRVMLNSRGRRRWGFVALGELKNGDYSEIDPRRFYTYGCLYVDTKEGFEKHRERGMVEYPSRRRFRAWKRDWGSRFTRSGYWPRMPRVKYVPCYSRFQIFPLKEIRDRLSLRLVDSALSAPDDAWVRLGRQTGEDSTRIIQSLRSRVMLYYGTFRLLQDILDLKDDMVAKADVVYEDSISDDSNGKNASLDWWACISRQERKRLPTLARKVLEKSGQPIEEIARRRIDFAFLGRSADPIKELFEVLENIPEDQLYQCRGPYRFVLDCYAIANVLGWFLEMLGESPPTLKKLFMGFDNVKQCPYCQEHYEPVRWDQETCGKKECVDKHRNKQKREKRRMK